MKSVQQISNDALVNELFRRIDGDGIGSKNYNRLDNFFGDEDGVFGCDCDCESDESPLPIETIDDQLKLEHLTKVWSKYNWDQITNLLPE